MKHYFLPLLFVLFATAAFAQSKIYLNKGEKIKKEGEFTGIMKDKEWIIQPKYDAILPGYGSYILAKRGNITDLYYNSFSTKALVVSELNPSQLEMFLILSIGEIKPLFSYGKWGFTYATTTIQPMYDSIFHINTINGGSGISYVGLKLNGKMGAISKTGEPFIPLDDYVSIQYEFNNVAIAGHNFLGIATRKNGARDFYAPYMNVFKVGGKLEDFEKEYIAGKEGAEYFKNFWKELKAFRNAEGALGLITNKGKIFLPASAERINFQSVAITANSEGGLKTNSDNFYLKNIASDTVVISTLLKDIYFYDKVHIGFQPKDLSSDYFQDNLTLNYDYKTPLIDAFSCSHCKNGVYYWDDITTQTKVIREEETVTQTSKVVWSELTDKGFGTVTSSYTIPAEVEKIVKSTPRSEVCGNCKGHVNYFKNFRWDEKSKSFLGYFSYGK